MNSLVRRSARQLSLWRSYCVKHGGPEAASPGEWFLAGIGDVLSALTTVNVRPQAGPTTRSSLAAISGRPAAALWSR